MSVGMVVTFAPQFSWVEVVSRLTSWGRVQSAHASLTGPNEAQWIMPPFLHVLDCAHISWKVRNGLKLRVKDEFGHHEHRGGW